MLKTVSETYPPVWFPVYPDYTLLDWSTSDLVLSIYLFLSVYFYSNLIYFSAKDIQWIDFYMRPILVDPVSKITIAYWDFEHGTCFFDRGWLKRNPNSETDCKFVEHWSKDPYKKVKPPKGNLKNAHFSFYFLATRSCSTVIWMLQYRPTNQKWELFIFQIFIGPDNG